MAIDVAATMRTVLPKLRRGVNGEGTADLRPECEDEWSDRYAIVQGLYRTRIGDGGQYDEFDIDRFQNDYETMVRSHFPDCNVKFYWRAQEIEVCRIG